jgi:hypothetical protein
MIFTIQGEQYMFSHFEIRIVRTFKEFSNFKFKKVKIHD